MNKFVVSDTFYRVKTRDRIGGTLRTDVFKKENGLYEAFSSYSQDEDEEIVGFASCYNDEEAIKQSRKNLRKEWIAEQEQKVLAHT